MTEHTIWSHDGQKDRFIIFGCGAPTMGKKYWGEPLRTTGVKFRSESDTHFGRPTAENYESIFLPIVRPIGVLFWLACE